jgi:hypothetical protein
LHPSHLLWNTVCKLNILKLFWGNPSFTPMKIFWMKYLMSEWVNDRKMKKKIEKIQFIKFYRMKHPMSEWVSDWMNKQCFIQNNFKDYEKDEGKKINYIFTKFATQTANLICCLNSELCFFKFYIFTHLLLNVQRG